MAASRRRPSRKRLPNTAPPHRGTVRLALVLAVLVGINLYVFLWRGKTSIPAVMEQAALAGKHSRPGSTPGSAPESGAAGEDDEPPDGDDDGLGPEEPGRELVEQAHKEDRWVAGKVEPGDSMGRILRRENLSPPEADEVIRALGDHMDLRRIRPGQDYRLHFDDEGRLLEFEFHISKTTTVRVRRGAGGELSGQKDRTPTETRIQEIGGHIHSSLYASMKDVGEDTNLVSFFVDVFAYDVNFFTDTHAGDTFRMVVEKEYVNDEFLSYRRVLAAEYQGKAGTFHAFYWKAPGEQEGRYYDADGQSVEKSLLKTPLKFSRISSKFNPKRMHPILHRQRGHMGVDYAAPTGTPVWSAADGKITFRGWRGGAGNCVIVRHDNGLETVYMHLSSFRKGHSVGQRVKGKTVIGYVGSTGMSTGPHLHFGVKQNGRYVDPLSLKITRSAGVPKKYMSRFKGEAGKLVNRLAQIQVREAMAQGNTRVDDGEDEGDDRTGSRGEVGAAQ